MKLAIVIICVIAVLAGFVQLGYAGVTLYEKGDLKVSISELSAGTAYDLSQHEWLAVAYTSIVQWKELNFDLGYIGELDNLNEKNGIMAGLSMDLLERNTPVNNLTANVGIFTGIRTKDIDDLSSRKIPFGIYTSAKFKF